MSAITTHVLDTSLGRPAAGVAVALERDGVVIGQGVTDADGRCKTLLADGVRPSLGTHRLTFDVGAYFASSGRMTFFPMVQITFAVTAPAEHHHVPLLLSPFSYSTYRGS